MYLIRMVGGGNMRGELRDRGGVRAKAIVVRAV